ncbi:MAG: hypothetical protein M1831_000833 [Alyxoria varia]|nr:MAG: hypothetical protein M1831_000833 [Alyxoria varia]
MPDPALFATRTRSSEDSNQKNAPATSSSKENTAAMKTQHPNSRRPPPRSAQGAPRQGGGRRRPPPSTPNRKRKLDDDGNEGPAPRRARLSGNQGPIHDPRYIIQNKPYPNREDYPDAPSALFREESVVDQVNRLSRTFGLELSQKNEQARTGMRIALQGYDLKGNPVEVHGEGPQKVWKIASRAAFMHYLSKLHENGNLKEMFDSSKVDSISSDTLKQEVDAKTEVYDYAARCGLIPSFSTKIVPLPAYERLRAGRNGNKAGRRLYEVQISLPEQNIQIEARNKQDLAAEISACLKFKEAAEKHYAEHADETLVVKDASTLHSGNLKNFYEFYKIHRRGVQFDVRMENKKGGPWKAQAIATGISSATASPNEDPQSPKEIGPPVSMSSKKKAETLAYLIAAVTLTQEEPTLMEDFRRALSRSGKILTPVRPVDMSLDEDAVYLMQQTLYDARKAGLGDIREEVVAEHKHDEERRLSSTMRQLQRSEIEEKNRELKQKQQRFESDARLEELRSKRAALPMTQHRDPVLDLVRNNQYSVVIGATGSGKTTQVPQLLLDEAIVRDDGANCNVICTQPRRIAATSVARRVADERNESLRNTVGYHVRFDSRRPRPGGSITYCTTGILLQQLQLNPDEVFDFVSHIVIDEVHERDILIDFLMIVTKNVVESRLAAGKRIPRIVLMSATIDAKAFENYFQTKSNDGKLLPCPSLSIPGRTFPVAEKYLPTILDDMRSSGNTPLSFSMDPNTTTYLDIEKKTFLQSNGGQADGDKGIEAVIDWKREAARTSDGKENTEKEDSLVPIALVAATISHISKNTPNGAILVFLPGYDEMRKTAEMLQKGQFGFTRDKESYRIFMLHSSVPASEQQEVFAPLAGHCRKIILSTNIAETSVTIPDVQYVVDTGKHREKRYDQTSRITKFQTTWISKSNAKQRAGRAGRVQDGHYYALFSKPRFDSFRAVGLPEMLRTDLSDICLDIKAQAFKAPIRNFLAQAIEPPSPEAVDVSVKNLQGLEALTEEEDLTSLGRLLAALPVHPSLGKMIVLGVIFRCLDPMIILGAGMTERSIFAAPVERKREAREKHMQFVEGTFSDHYALISAFTQMRFIKRKYGSDASNDFAFENFLHIGAYRSIEGVARQVEEVLVEAGLIPPVQDHMRFEGEFGPSSLNKNAENIPVIKALIVAGLHPNLSISTGRTLRTAEEKNLTIHPSSVNYNHLMKDRDQVYDQLFSFTAQQLSVDGSQNFLRDVSATSPLMATLFGGRLVSRGNVIDMDQWLPVYVRGGFRVVKLMIEFRKALDRLLASSFRKLSDLRSRKKMFNAPRGGAGGGFGNAAGGGAGSTSALAQSDDATAVDTMDAREGRGNDDELVDTRGGRRGRQEDEGLATLADDRVSALFSDGVVELLKRDSQTKIEQSKGSSSGGGGRGDSYRPRKQNGGGGGGGGGKSYSFGGF